MKNTIWQKRIPTFFALLILIIGVGATSFLARNGALFVGKASQSETPQNIRISNINDSSFTVSYTTSDKVPGGILLSKDGNSQTILDDRDQSSDINTYYTHHISLRGLSPLKTYEFSIISGQSTFMDNGSPFKTTTGPSLESSTLANSVTGRLILPTGEIPSDAIAYATIDGSQLVSSVVKKDGTYEIPLSNLRNEKLQVYIPIQDTTRLHLLFVGPATESHVNILLKQSSLVPLITLSNDYDFLTSTSPIATPSAEQSLFPLIPQINIPITSRDPQIITPKKDQGFNDNKPQFSGSASPSATIRILIKSQEIQAQVQADSSGRWSYRPTQGLEPGTHTISVTTQDRFGILKTISQSFVVYAQGTQINGPSVSGTPTPTPTPKINPTATPTPIQASPTTAPTLTPTPTVTIPNPTVSPSPTQVVIKPTTTVPTSALPAPGTSLFGLFSIGTTTVIIASIFVFLLSMI